MRLFAECGWRFPRDISADSFTVRARQTKAAAENSKNDFLDTARNFQKWMRGLGRIESATLESAGELGRNKNRRRRAASDEEMPRDLGCGRRPCVVNMSGGTQTQPVMGAILGVQNQPL